MRHSTAGIMLSMVAVLVHAAAALADEAVKSSGGADVTALFKQLDANTDGRLSTDEVTGDKLRLFKRLLRTADLNSDGRLSAKEFADGLSDDPQLPVIEFGTAGNDKPKPPREVGQMLLRLDANADGKVEIQEVPAARREFFKGVLERGDANHDGTLDRKEAARLGPSGERIKQVAAKKDAADADVDRLVERALAMDQNRDNRLSVKEAPKNLQKAFAKIDTNRDGQLDAQELKARFASALKKQRDKPDKSKKSDKPTD